MVHSVMVLLKPLKKLFHEGLGFCRTCPGKRLGLERRTWTETGSVSLSCFQGCIRVRCKVKLCSVVLRYESNTWRQLPVQVCWMGRLRECRQWCDERRDVVWRLAGLKYVGVIFWE